MPKCIECQREIKEGVIGKTCAKKLGGPKPNNALAMVRLLHRLKNEARNVNMKVEYDFKNSQATCIPLVHSPNTEAQQNLIKEQIKYYMEAHQVFNSSAERQLELAKSVENSRGKKSKSVVG